MRMYMCVYVSTSTSRAVYKLKEKSTVSVGMDEETGGGEKESRRRKKK